MLQTLLRRRLIPLLLLLALFARPGAPQSATETGPVIIADRVVFTLRASVGTISPQERAGIVNRRLERVLTERDLRPDTIRLEPRLGGNFHIRLENLPLIEVTEQDAAAEGTTREELAGRWERILRTTLTEVKPLYKPRQEKQAPHVSFVPLLLVAGLAFLVPVLASRFRRLPVPVVVGEIILGILIGQSGLNLITYNAWLQFLSEFGLAFLMFLSGLEVDFGLLSRSPKDGDRGGWQRNPAALAAIVVGITLILSTGVAVTLTASGLLTQPWMMALILSTVSLGLVLPTLKERGFTTTPYGQTLLLTALIADVVTMFLITIVAGWLSSGPTLKLFLGLGLVFVFGAAIRVGRVLTAFPVLRRVFEELGQATAQVPVRGSLALMLAFVAVSEGLGTEAILGAFLAGLLLALFAGKSGHEMHAKLEALGFGFFIPIFFIMVGARFDLKALLGSPQGLLLAPLLILSAFAVKLVAALPYRWLVSWRETFAGGMLISPGLSLIVAAAEIGQRLGLFTPAIYAALICVTLVTALLGPTGFQMLMPKTERARRQVLIAGAGRHGSLLAQRLSRQGWEVTLLTREVSAGKEARAAGCRLVEGDAADPERLRAAGIADAQTVIATTSSDTTNEAVCREAARLGVPHCIALIQDSERVGRLRGEGITPVTPLLSTLTVLEGMATHPSIFATLTEQTGEKQIAETVLTNPQMAARPLRALDFPGDVLVLAVARDGESLVPHGSTLLKAGDVVTFIGTPDAVEEALTRMSPPPQG